MSNTTQMTTDEINDWLASLIEPVMVDITWTRQQIFFYDDEFCLMHPEVKGCAYSPKRQWYGLQNIAIFEEWYKAGIENALLLTVKICAECRLIIPEWAANEFVRKFTLVGTFEKTSWDDAFGRPYKKGTTSEARKKQQKHAPEILQKVVDNACSANPKPLNTDFFEEIGESIGIGHSLVEKYYAHARKNDWVADSLLPVSNRQKSKK